MAGKVIVYIAVSADGFIADTKGSVSWLEDCVSEKETGYEEFIKGIDTVILGKTTYLQIIKELSVDIWPYEGKKCYVFTHEKMVPKEGIIFTQEDCRSFLSKRRLEKGGDIWLCGGACMINEWIQKDLIDEYHFTVMPVLLGSGISLFQGKNPCQALVLKKCRTMGNTLDVVYERKKEK